MMNISKSDFSRVCINAITAANDAVSLAEAEQICLQEYEKMIPRQVSSFDRMFLEGYTVLLSRPIQTSSYQGSGSNEDVFFLLPKAGLSHHLQKLCISSGSSPAQAQRIADELISRICSRNGY